MKFLNKKCLKAILVTSLAIILTIAPLTAQGIIAEEKSERTITTIGTIPTRPTSFPLSRPALGNIMVSAGMFHTVGLKSDGTVLAVGQNSSGQCNVSSWTDVVAVVGGSEHTVGLKSDGTVVAVGYNGYAQCDVSSWTDIVAVAAGEATTIGLKSNGTVVAIGYNGQGQCDVSGWTDIIAISSGGNQTVGLKADGTVIGTGSNEYYNGISSWNDIMQVSTGYPHTIGLNPDGTVAPAGSSGKHSAVQEWNNIVFISAGSWYSVGLKADGTVVAAGESTAAKCNVSEWTDIIGVSAGGGHTAGLKSDGTVVVAGENKYGENNTQDWILKVPDDAEAAAFDVRILNSLDSTIKYNSLDTLVLEFQIKSNSMDLFELLNNQGLKVAYDNEVLQLMLWNGSGIVDDSTLSTTRLTVQASGVRNGPWYPRLLAAKDEFSKIGYLSFEPGAQGEIFECDLEFQTIMRVRFTFKPGKTIQDVKANAIRLMTTQELEDYNQSQAVFLQDINSKQYYYGSLFDGIATPERDNLTAPIIEYTHTIVEENIPVFTDGVGNLVDSLTPDVLVTDLAFNNKSDKPLDLTMYVAIFSPEDELTHVVIDSKIIGVSETENLHTVLEIPENIQGNLEQDGYVLKVLLWDTVTLEPLTEPFTL